MVNSHSQPPSVTTLHASHRRIAHSRPEMSPPMRHGDIVAVDWCPRQGPDRVRVVGPSGSAADPKTA